METPAPFHLPSDAKCIGCGCALYRNESRRCPECGLEFDPADRLTYYAGNSGRAVRAMKRMLQYRTLSLLVGGLMMGFAIARWDEGFLGAAGTLLLALGLTLYFQTRAAWLLFGQSEAMRFLVAALMLAPIFLLGPILVPSLVAVEIRRRINDPREFLAQ